MSRTFIVALISGCFTILQINLVAQDNNDSKTLWGDGNSINLKDVGFFVAPSFGLTQLDESNTSLFNLRTGVSLKDEISFGAYFNTSLNQIQPKSETVSNVYLDYWSVGGFAEYTLFSKKLIHLTFPIYVGYGEVEMDNEGGNAGLGEANFFQVEPSALLEVNLHKYVRFNAGIGYRIVGEMDYRNLDQSNLSGLNGHVGLKFGLFR